MKTTLLNAVTDLNAQIDRATLIAIILFMGVCYAFYMYWKDLDKNRFNDKNLKMETTKTVTEQANELLAKIEAGLEVMKTITGENVQCILQYENVDKEVIKEISKIKGTSLTEPTGGYDKWYSTWVHSGVNSVSIRSKKYELKVEIVEE